MWKTGNLTVLKVVLRMLKKCLESYIITSFCTGDYCNIKYNTIGEWHAFNF